jgi:hypothetical protein
MSKSRDDAKHSAALDIHAECCVGNAPPRPDTPRLLPRRSTKAIALQLSELIEPITQEFQGRI